MLYQITKQKEKYRNGQIETTVGLGDEVIIDTRETGESQDHLSRVYCPD
jgi:uncharacterized protein YuzE